MSKKITIVDYGLGNILSAKQSFKKIIIESKIKAKVLISNTPEEINNSTHVVLPGQGAFKSCIRGLKKIEGMGLGDAKLMTGIGLLFGWQAIPFVLFISAVLGLFFAMPSLINNKKNLKSKIPFGPFIITACFIYFLYGDFLYSLILV